MQLRDLDNRNSTKTLDYYDMGGGQKSISFSSDANYILIQ